MDTPEEMVTEAIKRGFDSIGFSGHSFVKNSNYSMTAEKTDAYIEDVNRLKVKYKDMIKIFTGIEADMFSELDTSIYDYAIGSVHYFRINDELIDFDTDSKTVKSIIDKYFDGDGMKYALEYYHTLQKLPEYGKFDIIGHFDIITKHCEKEKFFDIDSSVYKNAAIEAAESLSGKIPFFEVNTGAIARGYRTTAYPAPFLIKELKRLGFGVVITSDCHNKNMLTCSFDEVREMLKSCGYKEKYVLTENGFEEAEL